MNETNQASQKNFKENHNHAKKAKESKKSHLKRALRRNTWKALFHVYLIILEVCLFLFIKSPKFYVPAIRDFLAKYFGNKDIYVLIIIALLMTFSIVRIIKITKKRKIIRNSYCPICGEPFLYNYRKGGFKSKYIDWDFSNTYRDHKKETWSGQVSAYCIHCHEHTKKFDVTFDTHAGPDVESVEDPRLDRQFRKKLSALFEHKRNHYIK